MHAYATARWTVPVGVAMIVAGALVIWAGIGAASTTVTAAAVLAGMGLSGLGVVAVLISTAAWAMRERDDRKMAKYGCSHCGYAPRTEDLEESPSVPCPACGEPLYPK